MGKEKTLEMERLIFFSDAVVAIAITLLALDLKLPSIQEDITFEHVFEAWPRFLAFSLSFLIIAMFWKIHHAFFAYIERIDERMMTFNLGWLFFITLLPFTTNLLSEHLTNKPAILLYCANIFLVSICQNAIWDYACGEFLFLPRFSISPAKPLIKETVDGHTITIYRIACNLAMGNSLAALLLSLWQPLLAILVLFARLLFFRTSALRWIERSLARRDAGAKGNEKKRRN